MLSRTMISRKAMWSLVAFGITAALGVSAYIGVSALSESKQVVSLSAPASAADLGGEGRIVIQTANSRGTIRQATPDECAMMAKLLEASLPTIRESHENGARAAGVPQAQIDADLEVLDRSADRSRVWLAAGCPRHDKLGVIDRPEGGKDLMLLDTLMIGAPIR